jgi:lipopolysaccharide transport system permease protein
MANAALEDQRNSGPSVPAQAAPAGAEADDLPVTVVERRSGWRLVDGGELWRYRELLFFLAWRDVKVRYKQTALGVAWAVLQPVATMAVFTLFLGRLAAAPASGVAYPLFVFAGILPWTLFANAVTAASSSVVGNQSLVSKVYFPRLIIPLSAVAASLVDFAVAFGVLVVLMLWHGATPGWGLLLAPVLLFGLVITAVGVGTLLAALTVAYRDFRYVVPFGVQLAMFATPCIYLQTEAVLDPGGRALLLLNPVHGLIDNFRRAMLGGPLEWPSLAAATGLGLLCLLLGCLYFRRVERSFADII